MRSKALKRATGAIQRGGEAFYWRALQVVEL